MANSCVSLQIDRSLIDSNFDGYKLSLDSIPLYKHQFEFRKCMSDNRVILTNNSKLANVRFMTVSSEVLLSHCMAMYF